MRVLDHLAEFLYEIVFDKRTGNYDLALEAVEKAYQALFGLDGKKLKLLSKAEIEEALDKDHIEALARLFYEEADIGNSLKGPNVESDTLRQEAEALLPGVAETLQF
jgi:hypothetical protein